MLYSCPFYFKTLLNILSFSEIFQFFSVCETKLSQTEVDEDLPDCQTVYETHCMGNTKAMCVPIPVKKCKLNTEKRNKISSNTKVGNQKQIGQSIYINNVNKVIK